MANNNPGAPQPVMHTAEAPNPIADPAPLGLAGFGLTTLMLSVINAGIISAGATLAVLPMAAAYGGTAQFLAGMWAFKRGNTFAATAFSSYGAFWWSYYLLVDVFLKGVTPSAIGPIVGLYLFAWFIFTGYMFLASLHGTRAVQVVFFLLTLTFLFLAAGTWAWFGDGTTLGHIGGYLGIVTAIAALYTSFADVLNATAKRVILPTN
ncbi:MAG TPA: acetate uptake transporter [Candidatus Dormibacteraeota bacterium]|nr:acetate uptake transporter [Candidatus Dormibacteraeota bacterium]